MHRCRDRTRRLSELCLLSVDFSCPYETFYKQYINVNKLEALGELVGSLSTSVMVGIYTKVLAGGRYDDLRSSSDPALLIPHATG